MPSAVRPVVLCGGAGTRLWPLSRRDRPKPLLALTSDDSLLRETLARAVRVGEPWVVCGAAHEDAIASHAPDVLRVVEPRPRGTAAAGVAAAVLAAAEDADALVLLVPADHAVSPDEAFAASIARGVPLAEDGHLVVFGVEARSASTQLGWIRPGAAVGDGFLVDTFVEKPGSEAAARYLREGWRWNSGMYLFRASTLLDEVGARAPELLEAVRDSVDGASRSASRVVLSPRFADAAEGSLDVWVMEDSERGAVIPATFRWMDVGTWPSVIEARGGRAGGLVLTDGPTVEILGDPDVLVAVTGGAVLVASPDALAAVGGLTTPNPAVLDSGPGWRVERWFVEAGDFHDGACTAILLAGGAVAMGSEVPLGAALPRGAVATRSGTWLRVLRE